MNIVATVQNVGTNDVTAASLSQSNLVGTGAESLDSAYELTLNKLDLPAGTVEKEVLIHVHSNLPMFLQHHTYQVMVKTLLKQGIPVTLMGYRDKRCNGYKSITNI